MHAKTGSLDDVRKSINEGADINHEDLDAHRALDYACEHSHADIALYLLNLGADPFPTKPIFKNTPLTHSVRGCMPEVCEALLRRASFSTIEKALPIRHAFDAKKRLLHLLCCFPMRLPQEIVLKIIADSEEYVWLLLSLRKAPREKIQFLYSCLGQEKAIDFLCPLALPQLKGYLRTGGLMSRKNAIECAQELLQEIKAWPEDKPQKREYMERAAHIVNLVNPELLQTNLRKLMKTLETGKSLRQGLLFM